MDRWLKIHALIWLPTQKQVLMLRRKYTSSFKRAKRWYICHTYVVQNITEPQKMREGPKKDGAVLLLSMGDEEHTYVCVCVFSCHFMVFGFIDLNLFGSLLEMGIPHCGVHHLNCSNQLYPRFIALKPSLEWLWQLKFVQKCDGKFVDLYKHPFISLSWRQAV